MRISLMAVHGNGGSSSRFRWTAVHLPDDIGLHAPTLPGFGGRPADPRITDAAGYAAVLAAELAPLPRPRAVLGSGTGGALVLELLRDHADLVDGVVLHAPALPLPRRPVIGEGLRGVLRRPAAAEAVQGLVGSQRLRPLVARRLLARGVAENRVDSLLNDVEHCQVFAQQLQITGPAWWASLPARAVPAVVLHGARDLRRPAPAAALRRVLPHLQAQVVPGWGPFPMVDAPAHYAAVVARAARAVTRSAAPAAG